MKLNIIFEDKDILVINKPTGVVVNKAITVKTITIQEQLEKYFGIHGLGIGDRAGIVHRLDRETSGLMMIAKNQRVFEYLQEQFKNREIRKEYIVLVHGNIKDAQGQMVSNIGRIGKYGKFGIVEDGRESHTAFEVTRRYIFDQEIFLKILKRLNLNKNRISYLKSNAVEYTLLKIRPRTGRTHQIRVHLKSIGSPVVSDSIYDPAKLYKFDVLWCERLFLHASYLEFKINKSKKAQKFASGLPKDLKSAILNLS